MEFELLKTFLLNSKKPKTDSPNRESSKAKFSKIVSWNARITNSILQILNHPPPPQKTYEFVILRLSRIRLYRVFQRFFFFFLEKIYKKPLKHPVLSNLKTIGSKLSPHSIIQGIPKIFLLFFLEKIYLHIKNL